MTAPHGALSVRAAQTAQKERRNMLDAKLKKYIAEANAVEMGRILSDDAVEALMEIHLSVVGIVAIGGESGYVSGNVGCAGGESGGGRGEAWYGSVASHRESMEKLFGICLRRCRGGSSLERRSRLVPVLYNMFHMPDASFDVRREMMAGRRACRAVEEWLSEAGGASRPVTGEERRTEYGILNCVIESMRYAAEEDKLANPAFQYMRSRVETWAGELSADGSWEGIGTGEALRRVDVMTGNSNVHGDNRFDALIMKARSRCFERIVGHDTETVPSMTDTADMTITAAVKSTMLNSREVFMLYRTLTWGIGPADWSRAEAVAKVASMQLETCPQGSDGRLWSLAVLIDLSCMKINEAVKRRTLAQSA